MPYVNNDGIRIYYKSEGQGPPLVLQHGLSDSAQGFRESGFIQELQNEYQLILIDARGHGFSDKPHDPAAYVLEQFVSDVIAVLDELGLDTVHYYGNSMGCRIGFGLANYAPQRLRSLVLGGSHPYAPSLKPFKDVLINGLEAWVATLGYMAGPLPPQTRNRLLSNDIQALLALVDNETADLSAMLPTLEIPCLLFAGGCDPSHEQARQAADEIPHGTFVSLPGLNHFQAYLRGDLVGPLILGHAVQFLAQVEQQLSSPTTV